MIRSLDHFVAARALAYFADALKTFVIPVLVFERTGSAVMSGVALAVEYVPKTMLTPFAGAFSQRFRLRPQFFVVDGIRALLCGALLFANSVALLMALSALIAVFTSYAYVLNESLVATAFERRTVALAQLQGADQIARVAGPAAGAALYVYLAHGVGVLALATTLFLISGLALFALPSSSDRRPSALHRSVTDGIVRGWQVVRNSPVLARLTALMVATNFAGGVVLAVAPPAIAELYRLPLSYFGVLGATGSGTAAVVVLIVGRFAKREAGTRFARLSLVSVALSLIVLAFAPSFVAFVAGYVLLTAGNVCYATYMRAERLKRIPSDALGETIGVLTSLVWLSVPLSGVFVALMARPAGLRGVVVISAAVSVVAIAFLQVGLGEGELTQADAELRLAEASKG